MCFMVLVLWVNAENCWLLNIAQRESFCITVIASGRKDCNLWRTGVAKQQFMILILELLWGGELKAEKQFFMIKSIFVKI